MANPPAEIPGMYWDAARSRYFQIPPSGAVPAVHAHSAESIRQRQEADRDAEAQLCAADMNKNRIRRAGGKLSSLQHDKINRELGGTRQMSAPLNYYLSQFDHIRLHGRNGRVNYRFPWDHSRAVPFPLLNAAAISGFSVFDVSTKHNTLLWTSDDYAISMVLASELDIRDKVSDNDRIDLRRPTNVCDGNGHLNSVNIHHASGIVLTTWEDASRGHNIWLTTLEGRCLFRPSSQHSARIEDGARTQDPRYIIDAVAVGKPANKYAFMVGGNFNKIVGIDKDDGGDTLFSLSKGAFENPHDEVFAVEMLEDDPNLYVVGQRSGLFRVFDDRAGTRVEAIRAQHVSSICKIKDMGSKKFVVSGLQDTMSVYDIRYMEAKNRTRSVTKIPGCPSLVAKGLAQTEEPYNIPVIWMPHHRNKHHRKADVAVDRTTGLIATAQHDGDTNLVRLFNMHTGQWVFDAPCGLASGNKYVSNQIRWVDDGQKGENALKALWFSKGPAIYSCRWDSSDRVCDEIVQEAA